MANITAGGHVTVALSEAAPSVSSTLVQPVNDAAVLTAAVDGLGADLVGDQRTDREIAIDKALQMVEDLQAEVATFSSRCTHALSVPYPPMMAAADQQAIKSRAESLLDFLSRENLNNLYIPAVGSAQDGDVADMVQIENRSTTDELFLMQSPGDRVSVLSTKRTRNRQ